MKSRCDFETDIVVVGMGLRELLRRSLPAIQTVKS